MIMIFQWGSLVNGDGVAEAEIQEIPRTNISLLEAIWFTISKQPNILLSKQQVKITKGTFTAEGAKFDVTLGANLKYNRHSTPLRENRDAVLDADGKLRNTSKTTEQKLEYSLGISKETRSGIEVSPSAKLTNTNDLTLGFDTTNRATVNFSVTIPLLRERGKAANAANETAAKIRYEASKFDLKNTISRNILNVVQTYWNTVEALDSLEITKETESRAETMLNKAQILVDAGEMPAVELITLEANLKGKTADRINRMQSLIEAKLNLGLEMAKTADEIASTPLPLDRLPEEKEIDLKQFPDEQSFVNLALTRRADLIASKMRQESANVLTVSARKNLKPKLDLQFDIGYTGLYEQKRSNFKRQFNAFDQNTAGANFTAMTSLEWPIINYFRRGTHIQRKAEHAQAVIRTNDLSRNIVSKVIVSMSDVIQSAKELRKAHKSVLLYRTAVQKERKKLKLGESTVIDLIDVDDRLTVAFLKEVSAKRSYANAVIRFRFETSTILSSPERDDFSINMKELTTVPSVN
jgi:outer membrane protein TolC